MSRMGWAGVAALTVFAGCMDDGAPTPADPTDDLAPPRDVWGAIKALLGDVPCTVDAVSESETSANLLRLTNASTGFGGHAELDIRGDLALAVGGGAVFTAYDVSDPLHPSILGNFTTENGGTGAGDLKFSPDNLTAVVGRGSTIHLVDVRDPADPVQVGEWTFPPDGLPHPFLNVHMLYTAAIDGGQWVFAAMNSNEGVWIFELEGPPEARTLTYVTRTLPVEGGPLGPHDMWAELDPDLGRWLLYVADGFHGWTVFDVSDPTRPLPIGGLVNPEPGYVHSIQATHFGLRRIVATTAEVGVNFLKVYDATVPAAPVLLGVWRAPQGPPQVDLIATEPLHDVNIVDGKLYVAHYGHGIYVFDLATLLPAPLVGTLELEPMAHFADPAGGGTGFRSFFDAVVHRGILYGTHMGLGLEVVGFGCLEPGNAALTSTGQPRAPVTRAPRTRRARPRRGSPVRAARRPPATR